MIDIQLKHFYKNVVFFLFTLCRQKYVSQEMQEHKYSSIHFDLKLKNLFL